jgi:hypothetical protein
VDRITGPLEIIAPSETGPALRVIGYDAAGPPNLIEVQNPDGSKGTFGSNPNALAEALGLVAWTADPRDLYQQAADSTQSMHGGAVLLRAGKKITYASELVVTAGATMTHGAFGIYDALMNLIAQTADTPAAFQTTGWVELPFTAPFTPPRDGLYYVLDLCTGGTMPVIGNAGSLATTNARWQLPGGALRIVSQTGVPGGLPNPLVPIVSGISRCILLR